MSYSAGSPWAKAATVRRRHAGWSGARAAILRLCARRCLSASAAPRLRTLGRAGICAHPASLAKHPG